MSISTHYIFAVHTHIYILYSYIYDLFIYNSYIYIKPSNPVVEVWHWQHALMYLIHNVLLLSVTYLSPNTAVYIVKMVLRPCLEWLVLLGELVATLYMILMPAPCMYFIHNVLLLSVTYLSPNTAVYIVKMVLRPCLEWLVLLGELVATLYMILIPAPCVLHSTEGLSLDHRGSWHRSTTNIWIRIWIGGYSPNNPLFWSKYPS